MNAPSNDHSSSLSGPDGIAMLVSVLRGFWLDANEETEWHILDLLPKLQCSSSSWRNSRHSFPLRKTQRKSYVKFMSFN